MVTTAHRSSRADGGPRFQLPSKTVEITGGDQDLAGHSATDEMFTHVDLGVLAYVMDLNPDAETVLRDDPGETPDLTLCHARPLT